MKLRKEYLIFGGVILAIVILLIGSQLANSNSRKKDVEQYVSFEDVDDSTELQTEVVTDIAETETQVLSDAFEEATTEEAVAETDFAPSVTEQVNETELSTETDDVKPEGYTEYSDSEIEPHLELDDDSVMTLVMYYVCNLNDEEGFSALLTDELVADRENRLESEPYKTLNGITKVDSLTKDGNYITLVVNEITYKFECSYTEDGTRISNISYVE